MKLQVSGLDISSLHAGHPHAKGPGEITGEILVRQKYGRLAGVGAPVDNIEGIISP